jgi:hypothetical protein
VAEIGKAIIEEAYSPSHSLAIKEQVVVQQQLTLNPI